LALGAAFDTHFSVSAVIDDKPDKPIILIGPLVREKRFWRRQIRNQATMGKASGDRHQYRRRTRRRMEQLAAFTRLAESESVESKTLTR